MVETTVRISEKGQIVIPKLLRDEFGMQPGTKILVKEVSEGVLLKKAKDPLEIFRRLAKEFKGKKLSIPTIEQEYEERARRAGINI